MFGILGSQFKGQIKGQIKGQVKGQFKGQFKGQVKGSSCSTVAAPSRGHGAFSVVGENEPFSSLFLSTRLLFQELISDRHSAKTNTLCLHSHVCKDSTVSFTWRGQVVALQGLRDSLIFEKEERRL